ncbi:hypothetical protein FRB99_008012, partial [Tulasnella sp. 403]
MASAIPHETVYLRVKRKREEEPATHMVAEIAARGAKKPRDSMSFVPGVFTYAETVEDSSLFNNQQYIDALSRKVTTLSQRPNISTAQVQISPSAGSPMSLSTTPASSTSVLAPLERKENASPTKAHPPKSYTIVPTPSTSLPSPQKPKSSRLTAPPVVKSSTAVPPKSVSETVPSYMFYEAVEDGSGSAEPEEEDPTMAQFASMVNDYLQLNQIAIEERRPASRLEPTSPSTNTGGESADDYVYDVFFFALKDVHDVNALLAKEAANIATVHGLPYWEFTDYDPEYGSDESAKDEADEDSNDEDYYRNDYPDDEDEVSDEAEIEE